MPQRQRPADRWTDDFTCKLKYTQCAASCCKGYSAYKNTVRINITVYPIKLKKNQMGRAKPDVRPPVAATPSAKSI